MMTGFFQAFNTIDGQTLALSLSSMLFHSVRYVTIFRLILMPFDSEKVLNCGIEEVREKPSKKFCSNRSGMDCSANKYFVQEQPLGWERDITRWSEVSLRRIEIDLRLPLTRFNWENWSNLSHWYYLSLFYKVLTYTRETIRKSCGEDWKLLHLKLSIEAWCPVNSVFEREKDKSWKYFWIYMFKELDAKSKNKAGVLEQRYFHLKFVFGISIYCDKQLP